jgi:tetratricopeptide (TPR) repeat protein
MAIRGSLTEASLPDVLQLLAMGKKTGCLGLTYANNFGYIYFADGAISHASIVNRNLSTEEAVYLLFTWTQGTFNFEPGATPDEGVPMHSIDPQSLLLEGARRVDEWALIAKKIPTFDIVYAMDRHRMMAIERELTPEEEKLVPLVDGQRDVSALIAESKLGEFVTAKTLYGLLMTGYMMRVGVSTRARAPARTDDKATEHRNLGVAFYKTGMYEESQREFRRVDALRENDPEASFYLGLVALRQEQWPAAAHAFERYVTQQHTSRPAVFVNLAYAYEQMGEMDRARAAMADALSHGGRGDPLVQTNAAAMAVAARDYETADAALAAARTLWGTRRPPPVWFHYAGLAAAMVNDLDRAIALLSEAVQVYPSYAVLWNNLAVAYEARGDFDDALRTLERGLIEDSTLPQLHRNFADSLQRDGRFDEAREAYRRAHTLDAQ